MDVDFYILFDLRAQISLYLSICVCGGGGGGGGWLLYSHASCKRTDMNRLNSLFEI